MPTADQRPHLKAVFHRHCYAEPIAPALLSVRVELGLRGLVSVLGMMNTTNSLLKVGSCVSCVGVGNAQATHEFGDKNG